MSKLLSQLQEAVNFLQEHPKLETSSDLVPAVKSLQKALDSFLKKAEGLRLELMPAYPEAAALLEGEGKGIATPQFMTDFCRKRLNQPFTAAKSDKKARLKFLALVAAGNQLGALKDALDPHKRGRELFDGLVGLDLETITEKVSKMNAKDLNSLVKANGFSAERTGTGQVSRTKKSINKIVAQIGRVKLTEHY